MTVLGSFTPVHSSFITIRKAAMAFVQARRMNPMEKVLVYSGLMLVCTCMLWFCAEKGFASTHN